VIIGLLFGPHVGYPNKKAQLSLAKTLQYMQFLLQYRPLRSSKVD